MKANHFQVKGHNSFEFKISYVDIDEKKLSKMKDEQIKRDLKRFHGR